MIVKARKLALVQFCFRQYLDVPRLFCHVLFLSPSPAQDPALSSVASFSHSLLICQIFSVFLGLTPQTLLTRVHLLCCWLSFHGGICLLFSHNLISIWRQDTIFACGCYNEISEGSDIIQKKLTVVSGFRHSSPESGSLI